jgi:hypothetical protein
VVRDAPAGRDPTYRLRLRMRAESDQRWQVFKQTLRSALIEHDLLGMRGVGLIPHGDKTEGFAAWLREELRTKVLGGDGSWMTPYVQEAAALAGARAAELAPGGRVDQARVTQMQSLAGSELRGIIEAAQQQLTRAVTQALLAIKTPTAAANATAGVLRTMCNRTRAMDDYIIVKTHGTATLSAFRSAGVTHVGVIPERVSKTTLDALLDAPRARGPVARSRKKTPSRSTIGRARAVQKRLRAALTEVDVVTAGDDRVCPVCEEIAEEGPYDLDTAEDMIPAHARCRCIFAPAGRYGRDAFDPDEPRDPHGEWTSGGAGGEHPGAGYSATAYVKGGVIYTNSVYDAQRALSENRKVDLDQLKSVSTLIKLLGDRAAAIEESGKVPPVFNLCNVSVEGTNIFCSENKGIPRAEMPVIAAKQTKAFIEHLKSKGYKVEKDDERAENLRATQSEISGAKVAAAMTRIKEDGFYKRLVISKDDYILDGHHTWAGQLGLDAKHGTLHADKSVKVARVNISITKLIAEAEKWTGGAGKKSASQSASDGDWIDAIDALFDLEQPRYAPGEISPHGGEFAPEGGWQGEPLKGSQGDSALISTARTMATGRPKSAEREQIKQESFDYQRIDMEQVRKDPEVFAGMVDTFRNSKIFPYLRTSDFNGDDEHDSRTIIDRMKSNMRALWNDTAQASKDLWRHWYVGAHDLVTDRMKEYPSVGRPAMTAVYAALSPGTQWDINVHQGDRLLDTVLHHGSDKWDKGMADAAQMQLENAAKGLKKKGERAQQNYAEMERILHEVKKNGSFDRQPDDMHRAQWVKLWNDAHDDTPVRNVGIDGKMGAAMKTKGLDDNGEPADMSGAFGTIKRIETALKALNSGSNARRISDTLGQNHKVRSFYNNILDPHSANDDVTIDTHATGAAWLEPLGQKSTVLGQMFGTSVKAGEPNSPKSARYGVRGTYPFYAQAYREFAKEVGLDHPRELQSILWEHKIELFKGAPKAKKALIHQAWERFHNDPSVSLEHTQRRVLQIAKAGYDPEGRKGRKKARDGGLDSFDDEAAWDSADGGELSVLQLVRRSPRGDVGRGSRGAAAGDYGPGGIAEELTVDYDPDEPRDPHGQWTSGGGGEAIAARPVNPEVVDIGGDQWNKQTALRLETEYEGAYHDLDAIAHGLVEASKAEPVEPPSEEDEPEPSYEPSTWDEMSGTDQEKTTDYYKMHEFNSIYENEVQNWQEENSVDDAKSNLQYEFEKHNDDWAVDAVNELKQEMRIPYKAEDVVKALKIEYQTGYGSDKDPDVGIDHTKLPEPEGWKFSEKEPSLPGIEPPSHEMPEAMTEAINAKVVEAFNKQAEKMSSDLEPPEYLTESAQEFLEEGWEQMTNKQKFIYAQEAGVLDKEMSSSKPVVPQKLDKLPDDFDPLGEVEQHQDYKRTQLVARELSVRRAAALMLEREVEFPGVKSLLPEELKMGRESVNYRQAHDVAIRAATKMDNDLWTQWKSSSTSPGGKLLQIAIADELGGRLRTSEKQLPAQEVTELKDRRIALDHANERYPGGYQAVKAYIRGKWETTQYMLDKAGRNTLNLYRGVRVDTSKEPKQAIESPSGEWIKYPQVKLERNGASSWTTDRTVANDWIAKNAGVVLRTQVPRTAAISVPAYGINMHGEHEVVLGGLAMKGWDAWQTPAPMLHSDMPHTGKIMHQ